MQRCNFSDPSDPIAGGRWYYYLHVAKTSDRLISKYIFCISIGFQLVGQVEMHRLGLIGF